ncbi:MAG: hypothetical protein OXE84_02525 [Rhodobacteraceae bacterium]|nr:hypothetical protein [Paracoccaceae bacterium]
MKHNTLVDFLAAYGPTSDGNNMYDEFVVSAAEEAGVEPISIPEDYSKKILKDLTSDQPRSVILTGTAGDGKTYTARKVLESLSEGIATWGNTEDTYVWHVPNSDRRIVFVKDLSEIGQTGKASIIGRLVEAFTNPMSREYFVLCVNDGHLLRTWKEHTNGDHRGDKILMTLRELLRDDEQIPSDGMAFRLINMSRTSHAKTIDAIIDQICSHPGWNSCGKECTSHSIEVCPIQINRKILLNHENASLRNRLRALIEIAAADESHLSIRQIIILIVNALLGDSKKPDQTPLLNCARAKQRAADNEYKYTNPYNNLFGENHPSSRRQQHLAFEVLSGFGIGFETNNFFDDQSININENSGRASEGDHPQYGTSSYKQLLANYNANPGANIRSLRDALRAQRRLLFFEWPDPIENSREESPWQLTVHNYGDLYLNLLNEEGKRDDGQFTLTRLKIIKGLNRALTGSLTETSDRLWLTQPSGVYNGADIPILATNPIGWKGMPYFLSLAAPVIPGRPPELQLMAAYPKRRILTSLHLRPTLFEYLMRINDGALPMSFSNQCFQDVRNFQIRCVGEILDNEEDDFLDFKSVDTSGELLAECAIGSLIGE